MKTQEPKITHTPGPWALQDLGLEAHLKTNDRFLIVSTFFRVATVPGDGTETAANAILIAAAPELLAALKHLIRNGGPGDFPQAEAAIAKAEGR